MVEPVIFFFFLAMLLIASVGNRFWRSSVGVVGELGWIYQVSFPDYWVLQRGSQYISVQKGINLVFHWWIALVLIVVLKREFEANECAGRHFRAKVFRSQNALVRRSMMQVEVAYADENK